MDSLIETALALWGIEGARCSLVAARENHVFKVTSGDETFALRVHRPELRSNTQLRSELCWMVELSRSGLSVPRPMKSRSGELLHQVDGHQVDLLTWLSGAPLGSTSKPLDHPDRTGTFFRLGETLATVHLVSDAWIPPVDFDRIVWDRQALTGPAPLWGRFWENPELTAAESETLQAFRQAATEDLLRLENSLDYGLIHADAVRENIMVDGRKLYLIDFDDCGYGYRLFEVATALIKNMGEPDFADLKAALLQGYLALRELDVEALDLFLALRAATYVGWNIARLHEQDAGTRNSRMIAQAISLAEIYLSTRNGSNTHTLEVSP